MQSWQRLSPQKPCIVTYFQADDTELEFEEAETPVSKYFDQIKSMIYFLWMRSAVAFMCASQRDTASSVIDEPADTETIDNSIEIPQEVTEEELASQIGNENSKHLEDVVEADEVLMEDQVPVTDPEIETSIEAEHSELTTDPVKEEEQVTIDSERPSTMHAREGDRVVALKDEFLDPMLEAISLDFGRPLEIVETGVPPLREKSKPEASST
jgi:hypothetical protein